MEDIMVETKDTYFCATCNLHGINKPECHRCGSQKVVLEPRRDTAMVIAVFARPRKTKHHMLMAGYRRRRRR